MNLPLHLRSFLLLAGISLLAACAASPLSRIDSNRALYESWPLEVQEAVLSGQVKQGMTPEMVQMSVGRPSQVINRSVQAGDDEVWVYRKGGGGGSLLKNTGISIGAGTGGIGVGTNTSIGGGGGGSVEEEHEVVFQKGVVVRTDF
ncbi:MAG: hypothetical protein ABIO94_05425 [Opitutaceae bacterium]